MNNYDIIDGDFFESLGNGNDIVYYPIDNVENAFESDTHHKVLITHNGDRCVDEELYQKFKECGKYDVWFAQNVNCKHQDLKCIPIGLERKRWCSFSKYDVIEQCKKEFKGEPTKILYGNFSIRTNSQKRKQCAESFRGKNYFTDKIQYSTPNVFQLTIEQYRNFCNELLDHKFVLCPEGNGIDTHRLWETLYLGRIPVVLHNHVNDSFSDLPMLILDKWEDFDNKYEDFKKETNNNMKKLSQDYWKKRINGI